MRFSSFFPDLTGYTAAYFSKDLMAGLVTGIVAIPLSLGLAIATGVPPVWGLYTAAVAGLVAALFAGSRYSVSGVAAAMIPILAPIITTYGLSQLPIIGFLAGCFLILMGLLKFGNFIRYIPPAVTYGFTAGIAVVIFAGQINSFLGLSGITPAAHFHEKLLVTLTHLATTSLPTLALGTLSLLILILLPRIPGIIGRIPASLVAVLVATLLPILIPYFSTVTTIQDAFGAIALGLPPLTLSLPWDAALSLSVPALKIALLIAVESLLCAVAADQMTRTRHNPNQELAAQGIANLICPFFSSIPATAVIARTGTNIKNGAHSRIASIIHALLIIIFLALLAPYGSMIPLTTLSAILFITAWKISETPELIHLLKKAPTADRVVLILTFFLTVFVDLVVSVGLGLFLSALIIFRKLSSIRTEEITANSSFVDETIRQALRDHPETQFINIQGNLSMGFGQSLIEALPTRPATRRVILRLREVSHIDLSGLSALSDYITDLRAKRIAVTLACIDATLLPDFRRYGILSAADSVYATITDAVRALYPNRERRSAPKTIAHDRRKR